MPPGKPPKKLPRRQIHSAFLDSDADCASQYLLQCTKERLYANSYFRSLIVPADASDMGADPVRLKSPPAGNKIMSEATESPSSTPRAKHKALPTSQAASKSELDWL
jgi:hypothetical protein